MHKQYEKDMVKHLSNCVKYYGHTDESRVTAMVAPCCCENFVGTSLFAGNGDWAA